MATTTIQPPRLFTERSLHILLLLSTLIPYHTGAFDMASINDMPRELLDQVVWYLQDNKADLISLALVSSAFSSLVQQKLLQAISFTVDEGKLARYPRQFTPLRQLLQTLAVKPEFALHVHSLDLTWYCLSGFNDFELDAETDLRVGLSMMDKLLQNVRSLRYLRYSAPLYGSDYFEPTFLSKNKMRSLTEVVIMETSTIYYVIVAFMRLERIKTLTVGNVIRRSRSEMSLSNSDHHNLGSSPINSLILGGTMSPEDICSFCSIARQLKCLSFGFLYSAEPRNWAIGTVLRPSLFSWAISPSKQSLESLEIQSDRFEALDIDRTRLDLNDFWSLRTLTLPSNFIFTTAVDDPSRDGLWKLLPPQLEHLKVSLLEIKLTFLTADSVDIIRRGPRACWD